MSDADIARAAAAEERAAVAAYRAAAGTGKLSPDDTAVGALFARHHAEHAAAFEKLVPTAPLPPDGGLRRLLVGRIDHASDGPAVVRILFDLENHLASTHLAALGRMQDAAKAGTTATILPVESQHAVAWGTVLELPPTDLVATFESDADALTD